MTKPLEGGRSRLKACFHEWLLGHSQGAIPFSAFKKLSSRICCPSYNPGTRKLGPGGCCHQPNLDTGIWNSATAAPRISSPHLWTWRWHTGNLTSRIWHNPYLSHFHFSNLTKPNLHPESLLLGCSFIFSASVAQEDPWSQCWFNHILYRDSSVSTLGNHCLRYTQSYFFLPATHVPFS